ncbi:MAG: hypothetical protein Q9203_004312 [Teloschistes exilis]
MADIVRVKRVLMSTTLTAIEHITVGEIYRERVDPQEIKIVCRAGDGGGDDDDDDDDDDDVQNWVYNDQDSSVATDKA